MDKLSTLKKLELVSEMDDRWRITKKSIHLPQESLLNNLNHQNWRNLASLDIQKRNTKSLHYSAVHSLSLKDIDVLREKILKLVQESQGIVEKSAEEEIVCLCIDYFIL